MPKLVRLYILSVVVGFAVAALFVAGLVLLDVGGLRHLVQGDSGPLAIFLLWFFNGIVFSGVQFAYRIMRMAEKPQPPQGGNRAPVTAPRPALAKAPARR
ncbi:hypothetical protein [Pseudooceanicola sp.]|uniref:hypothetical protein n=1 Tax=Pseudooceanicola sp. TaxID=1914328 RepID=UPI00261537A8|nr:hypothetical protein [Pseudooceanicola sp.]MDF1853921.1 hypothetical protein [Pseudooceanicola sp.]